MTPELHKSIRNSVVTAVGAILGMFITYLLGKTGIDFGDVINPFILPLSMVVSMVLTNLANYLTNLWRV